MLERLDQFRKWVSPVLIAAACILMVNVGWLLPALKESREDASRLALSHGYAVRNDLAERIQSTTVALESAGTEIGIESSRMQVVFNRLFREHAAIGRISLADSSGREYAVQSRFAVVGEDDKRTYDKDSFFYAALSGAPTLGGVRFDPAGGAMLSMAVPVRAGGVGDLHAVLIAEMNVGALVGRGNMLSFDTGIVYVVDREGYILLHPDDSVVAQHTNVFERPIVQALLTDGVEVVGTEEISRYPGPDGEMKFAVGVPLTEVGWGVVAEQPLSVALSSERKIILLSVAFSMVGLLFLYVVLRKRAELEKFNRSLRRVLAENQQSAKMLIQKDRELHDANDVLEHANEELNETAKTLIRRDLELSEANSRLEELDTIKSEFVSVAAHQLRTPLTGIRWTLKGLVSGEFGELMPDQKRIAEEALRAIVGAIDLINDLLNVARIEGGRFGFAFADQPIATVLSRVIERAKTIAERKGIEFSASELPLVAMHIDAEKLEMAFDNLLDNAIKYTVPPGKVSIDVAVQDSNLVVVVRDTGIGIPKDEQRRLFTKFFRAPNAVLLQTSGTGLGLYLVKNIIDKHSGSIHLESAEQQGTTITVTIPIVTKGTRLSSAQYPRRPKDI